MPYSNQPRKAFWRSCRNDENFLARELYTPKHGLKPGHKIATAGSCFAQNIGRFIKASDLDFIDVEPAPDVLRDTARQPFGYDLFSARYGNIYTPCQFRQLLEDCTRLTVHDAAVWHKDDRVFDALRPNVEPMGYGSVDQMRIHRIEHLRRVRSIFENVDTFIFTMGLTESWQHTTTGLAFPSVPGLIAGQFDPGVHSFVNFGFSETLTHMLDAIALMRQMAPDIKVILTVSPVPLTATATDHHVLRATTYSKAVLRAVAEEIVLQDPQVDYFPSFEMITGAPFAANAYGENLRTVTSSAIDMVMDVFFSAHPDLAQPDLGPASRVQAAAGDDEPRQDDICEEALLEAFRSS